jgi:hypothetical protein
MSALLRDSIYVFPELQQGSARSAATSFGPASQTSDVSILYKPLRRLATLHTVHGDEHPALLPDAPGRVCTEGRRSDSRPLAFFAGGLDIDF